MDISLSTFDIHNQQRGVFLGNKEIRSKIYPNVTTQLLIPLKYLVDFFDHFLVVLQPIICLLSNQLLQERCIKSYHIDPVTIFLVVKMAVICYCCWRNCAWGHVEVLLDYLSNIHTNSNLLLPPVFLQLRCLHYTSNYWLFFDEIGLKFNSFWIIKLQSAG